MARRTMSGNCTFTASGILVIFFIIALNHALTAAVNLFLTTVDNRTQAVLDMPPCSCDQPTCLR